MPKDNIDRAIKKAQGGEADTYEEIRYEGFGPGGVRPDRRGADRQPQPRGRQRAHPVRQERRQPGRDRLGRLHVRPAGPDPLSAAAGSDDAVMEAAIEAGAEDVESATRTATSSITAFEDLSPVAEALEATLGPARATGVIWRPKTLTPVSERRRRAPCSSLIDALDDDDDVQNVWTNADLREDLARLSRLTPAGFAAVDSR